MQKGDKMGRIFKIVLMVYCFLAVQALLAGCSNGNPVKDVKKTYLPQNKETPETNKTGNTEGMEGFKGVEWTKEDEEKYAIYHGSLDICTDRDNGGAYYVNWGYDNYLYYWKDGKTKLVLDKWVSQICYMDGIIYCIYDKTGKSYDPDVDPSYEGIICSFNVKTGEFKEFLQVKAKWLAVCKEGLYYSWFTGPDEKEMKTEEGFYSFGSQEISKIDDTTQNGIYQERYGKYAIVEKYDGGYIRNLGDGSEQKIINIKNADTDFILTNICAGRCYYRMVSNGSKETYVVNLKDGSRQRIHSAIGFIQLNENTGYLYASGGKTGDIAVYDPVKNTYKYTYIKNAYSDVHRNYMMEKLYSDGEYLYTTAHSGTICEGIIGFVVLKADGGEVSEAWSSLEYYNKKNKK